MSLLFNMLSATAAKSIQSCLTLCDPIDDSPPGFPIPARDVLQARTLEWVAISFSNAWKWKVKVKSLSPVWLLATPWTAAYQAPPSMGFSRQDYWSGVPLPSPREAHYLLLKNCLLCLPSAQCKLLEQEFFCLLYCWIPRAWKGAWHVIITQKKHVEFKYDCVKESKLVYL